jgi:sigma-E factor negative regulatory protein RseC
MESNIEHKGVIRKITDDFYFVSFERPAACHDCTAKTFCSRNADTDDLIKVQRLPRQNFNEGDEITLSITQKMGLKAMLYGYIFPFIILIAGIVIATAATDLSQGIVGLIGIGALALYYVAFNFFREKIDRQFSFRIEG